MSKGRFTLNRRGVRELLRSEELAGACAEYAAGIQARAGEGFAVTTHTGKNRVNASVHAETFGARQKVRRDNNYLLKAAGK